MKSKLNLFAALGLFIGTSMGAFAQTAQNQQSIDLNQEVGSVRLEESEFETIYRTEQVPATCTRTEIQGTRRECSLENYPVCVSVPRQYCQVIQNCTTVYRRICGPNGCQTIPQQICQPQQYCQTQFEQICRTESRQVCRDVPNAVQVEYACTRPTQVPAGQQLKMKTVAEVEVRVVNLSEMGSMTDKINVQLSQGKIQLGRIGISDATHLMHMVHQESSTQAISANEQLIRQKIYIRGHSIGLLNLALTQPIGAFKLMRDQIEFKSPIIRLGLPLLGNIKLVKQRRARSDLILANTTFGAESLIQQGDEARLPLKTIRVGSLDERPHEVNFRLDLDREKLRSILINPENLGQLVPTAATVQTTISP